MGIFNYNNNIRHRMKMYGSVKKYREMKKS